MPNPISRQTHEAPKQEVRPAGEEARSKQHLTGSATLPTPTGSNTAIVAPEPELNDLPSEQDNPFECTPVSASLTNYHRPVIIKDAFGLEWEIKEARPTKHGFDIYYGKRRYTSSRERGGVNFLIYTDDLKTFWTKHSLRHDGILFDLPAGRTTLKRARKALGFNWDDDSVKFWNQHKADLQNLKPEVFEQTFKKRYEGQNLSGCRMSEWRRKLLGARARPLGWWQTTETLRLLLSEKSLNEIRRELPEKIGTTHASRLRRRAKRAYELRNGEPIQVADIPPYEG